MRSVRRAQANGNAGFAGFASRGHREIEKGFASILLSLFPSAFHPSSEFSHCRCLALSQVSDLVRGSLQSPDATPRTKSGPVACKTGLPRVGSESARVSAMTHETTWWGLSRRSPVRGNWLAAKEMEGRGWLLHTMQCHNAILVLGLCVRRGRLHAVGELVMLAFPNLRMRSSGALGNLEMLT
ncbi:hypothetical protein ACMYSQ_007455 [Aspergillus niger]